MFFKQKFRYNRKKYKKKPLKTKHVVIISLMLFVFINLGSLWMVDRIIEPLLITMIKTEVNELTTSTITNSVRNSVSKVNMDDLIIIRDKGDGYSPTYSFNQTSYNKILADVSDELSNELGKMTNQLDGNHEASTTYSIPLGVITDNSLLSNLGPDIPIELFIVSDVTPEIKTTLTSSGINNTFLELFIHLNVGVQVAIPSYTDRQVVTTDVKIGDIFIPGEVPEYYGGNENNPAPIIIEPKKEE
ncbi:sporulation protein YunB [Bacillus weihaiensis]|uniref:Sporulation protein YunB n=1 Tax=Bacillus weihaiensis TaxID=1547283 RepID=A0A1L3MUB8_9BACI|nr:sporulation protein YunB [Bacillus weihaiensis]APH05914.1 sporulation protein YunB [Bacillus weihaiensis]